MFFIRNKLFNLFILFSLLLFRIAVVFGCDLDGHFQFDVSNNDSLLMYSGCYDAINRGPHIIEYLLSKERAESTGISRPSATFSQNRDGGVLQRLLRENGYSLPTHADFTNSGYDRGHMAPNADFNDTQANALTTFFIANVWPQTPDVNRVVWLRTENETRRLASVHELVKVVIIVDEFTEMKVRDISVPLVFRRRVFNSFTGDLIYEIDVYQYERPAAEENREEPVMEESQEIREYLEGSDKFEEIFRNGQKPWSQGRRPLFNRRDSL